MKLGIFRRRRRGNDSREEESKGERNSRRNKGCKGERNKTKTERIAEKGNKGGRV